EPGNGEINETGDRGQPALASGGEGIGNLTVDIELELARRGVADSHGARSSMTGKPWDLPLVEVPLTREAIHDLHLLRTASHSCFGGESIWRNRALAGSRRAVTATMSARAWRWAM